MNVGLFFRLVATLLIAIIGTVLFIDDYESYGFLENMMKPIIATALIAFVWLHDR